MNVSMQAVGSSCFQNEKSILDVVDALALVLRKVVDIAGSVFKAAFPSTPKTEDSWKDPLFTNLSTNTTVDDGEDWL